MTGRAFQVKLLEERWAVVRDGDDRPVSLFERRQDAVCEAGDLAAFHDVELVVYDAGGRPLPPDQDRSRWAEPVLSSV